MINIIKRRTEIQRGSIHSFDFIRKQLITLLQHWVCPVMSNENHALFNHTRRCTNKPRLMTVEGNAQTTATLWCATLFTDLSVISYGPVAINDIIKSYREQTVNINHQVFIQEYYSTWGSEPQFISQHFSYAVFVWVVDNFVFLSNLIYRFFFFICTSPWISCHDNIWILGEYSPEWACDS